MVKIPQHKVSKQDMFYVSFSRILCKIRQKTFVTSVFSKSYKLMKKTKQN